MHRFVRLVVIVTLVASGLFAGLWSQQRRLIYFPSPGPVPSAELVGGRDVVLEKFEVAMPSVEEIFIRAVEEEPA